MNPITLLIADDHEVVRVGLTSLLGKRRELQIVGAVPSAEEAITTARASAGRGGDGCAHAWGQRGRGVP